MNGYGHTIRAAPGLPAPRLSLNLVGRSRSAMNALLALCTCPTPELAERIARMLVEERLAACVNRVPGVRSTYRWQDKVRTDSEVLLLIKTTRDRFAALTARILELHAHEVPEVIAVEVTAGLDRYLHWIEEETRPE